jgi:hypothetical protein
MAEPTGQFTDILREQMRGRIPSPEKAKLWAQIKKSMMGGEGKKAATGLVAWLALERIISAGEGMAERGIQREAIRGQAELATPENLYYQAAQPSSG